MELCTNLQNRILDLEHTKTTQALEIESLKRRVKKLEKKQSLGEQEDASKQGKKIHDIDADEDITLENVHDAEMFDVNDLHGDEVFIEKEVPVKEVSTADLVTTAGEILTTANVAVSTASTIPVSTATTTVADEVEMTLHYYTKGYKDLLIDIGSIQTSSYVEKVKGMESINIGFLEKTDVYDLISIE
ncbi:hypothetical protein Tco_1334391, partial [Tanacetum coccineum]